MKRPSLTDLPVGRSSNRRDIDDRERNVDEQLTKALIEAIQAKDKTIEIRPAEQSRGSRLPRLLLFVAASIAISYWLRTSQKPTEMIESATRTTADRTKNVTEQAADKIQGGGETVAERVEEGSEEASEAVEETGQAAAEKAEQTGKAAADKADSNDSGPT